MIWTDEAKEKERQRILKTKPWAYPRPEQARRNSASNSLKDGCRSKAFLLLATQLSAMNKLRLDVNNIFG